MAPPAKTKVRRFHWKKVHDHRCGTGTFWGTHAAPLPLQDDRLLDTFSLTKAERLKEKEAKTKQRDAGVLPSKRAQNIGIVVGRLRLGVDALAEAILVMDEDILPLDTLQSLLTILPTDEEVSKINDAKAKGRKLGPADEFVDRAARIPCVQARMEAWVFALEFGELAGSIADNIQVLETACAAIRESGALRTAMYTVLSLGNALNVGTAQGNAKGFTIDNLAKLRAVSAAGGKYTLLRYLVELMHEHNQELFQLRALKKPFEAASMLSISLVASQLKEVEAGAADVHAVLAQLQGEGKGAAEGVRDEFVPQMTKRIAVCDAKVKQLTQRFNSIQKQLLALCEFFVEDQNTFDERAFFACFATFCCDLDEEIEALEGRERRRQRQEEKAEAEKAKAKAKEAAAAAPAPDASPTIRPRGYRRPDPELKRRVQDVLAQKRDQTPPPRRGVSPSSDREWS
eukprot:TRINITY_DN1687_c2_g2_i1.p1 TRINITY_DN1687_c2_g2~~TRINITY_DN1687_c2_g2_i1.p1  ORF type:complete len:524 (+),score=205.67 TRINITY_DN1687_c2_g2_i1:202-1572(+)